ncbi:uncharacterized protein LOC122653963 [Telopea speciosissima]|uniref:uncharacterized protein LOC122653963 n=1 Tax=Telopea speciosissima TaxID=54955 RepID=UPI001CC7356D|nr:uncharacterized protein LOC122653963 [Telopea speciosissima]XP_043703865.1 uncharacterized protein LOC122653963 [Telopea speciosissima]
MAGSRVEVINSKGCSRLSVGISSSLSSLRGMQSFEPTYPASSAMSQPAVRASGPFAGLVICVTGLSKEARKQVMDATDKLGGQYSPSLHSRCTHLVAQSFSGRKFEHALKHGLRNGLFVVTLGWFVDSVKRNVRLSESLYSVKTVGERGLQTEELNRLLGFTATENTCLPVGLRGDTKQYSDTLQPHTHVTEKENRKTGGAAVLSRHSIFVDSDISTELRSKVVETAIQEGATIVDHWLVGCGASHVVCEGPSVQRYLGHTDNVVTPFWILKTTKEKNKQRLVHLSADLARQVGMILENFQNVIAVKEANGVDACQDSLNFQLAQRKFIKIPEERQKTVDLAKIGVRNRRGYCMQTFQAPIRSIAPISLLDSICWSISEPTSTACIHTDSSGFEDVSDHHTSIFFDARGDGGDPETSFENFSRPLRESEKAELIFKNHFLTILFPIDRFGEMGPSSRTYFSDSGFTCLQVLDYIYAFYQENMSSDDVDAAIHTDSRYAERLRSVYASKETAELGFVRFKRINFLGSRKSFEMLKRVSVDNNSNVYELLIRA